MQDFCHATNSVKSVTKTCHHRRQPLHIAQNTTHSRQINTLDTGSHSKFSPPFSRWTWGSRYQNDSILDFTGAKDDGSGGDNWSNKTCKAPVKSSPPINQHPALLQAGCPSCRPTNSVGALKGKLRTLIFRMKRSLKIVCRHGYKTRRRS